MYVIKLVEQILACYSGEVNSNKGELTDRNSSSVADDDMDLVFAEQRFGPLRREALDRRRIYRSDLGHLSHHNGFSAGVHQPSLYPKECILDSNSMALGAETRCNHNDCLLGPNNI
ncbi:hypothetical protein VNO78_05566 [Psophocarpus tetragonolobus]|uniref:Uncharacterized protein n=1 Tax=Psophocarpus tetragonolobus TaxID=3891 RepID=A0AAN9ST28_PSOTE